ncbi:MAG: tyrosine-type recombinase/integrase [Bacillota bacterium]
MPKIVPNKELINAELGIPFEVLDLLSERELITQTSQAKKLKAKREGTYKEYRNTGEKTTEPIRKQMWIERIYDALETPRDKILFLAGILLGMRVSDTIKLTYGQLKSRTSNNSYVVEQKTSKGKKFYVNKMLRDAVDELGKEKGLKDEDYLFLSRKWKDQIAEGKPPYITTVQAFRILKKAAKKVRYSGSLSCHSLRKTFGYWNYKTYQETNGKLGASLEQLQKIYNHSDSSVTLKYIGITDREINAVYQNMDKIYGFRNR